MYDPRSIWCEGRKTLEYLVEEFNLDAHTWITEDHLRISPSPSLAAELKGNQLLQESLALGILRNKLLTHLKQRPFMIP